MDTGRTAGNLKVTLWRDIGDVVKCRELLDTSSGQRAIGVVFTSRDLLGMSSVVDIYSGCLRNKRGIGDVFRSEELFEIALRVENFWGHQN